MPKVFCSSSALSVRSIVFIFDQNSARVCGVSLAHQRSVALALLLLDRNNDSYLLRRDIAQLYRLLSLLTSEVLECTTV